MRGNRPPFCFPSNWKKMAETYDVSPEFRKLFERKQKQRAEFRAHYLKEWLNPYRHATQEGGHIFDPAIHRFHAAHAYCYEHFRPNRRNFMWLWGALIIPCYLNIILVKTHRESYISKVRTGQIAYTDRKYKVKF